MRHPLFLSITLLLITAISWLMADLGDDTQSKTDKLPPREIDYYLSGLNVTNMTAEGRPAHSLQAEQIKHFKNDETTEISGVQFTIHQTDQPPWIIRAASGWISPDGELILLKGDVTMEREASAGLKPFHMTTQNLRIQPSEDYAETDEKVRVISNSDRIDATGMKAWLRQPSRIKFIADVKGSYAPPP